MEPSNGGHALGILSYLILDDSTFQFLKFVHCHSFVCLLCHPIWNCQDFVFFSSFYRNSLRSDFWNVIRFIFMLLTKLWWQIAVNVFWIKTKCKYKIQNSRKDRETWWHIFSFSIFNFWFNAFWIKSGE